MKCNKIKRKLSAYLDNELKEKEHYLISEHLKICANCKKELAVFSQQNDFITEVETIEPSMDFKPNFWQKIRDAESTVLAPLGNNIAEKIWRWIPVPVFCSFVIFIFLVFSVVSPLLYGQNIKTSEKIVQLVKKMCLPTNQQKIFSPLNFSDFCEEYCRILCKHCENKTGSISEHSGCGRCEK